LASGCPSFHGLLQDPSVVFAGNAADPPLRDALTLPMLDDAAHIDVTGNRGMTVKTIHVGAERHMLVAEQVRQLQQPGAIAFHGGAYVHRQTPKTHHASFGNGTRLIDCQLARPPRDHLGMRGWP
jgi:hypothetical protein